MMEAGVPAPYSALNCPTVDTAGEGPVGGWGGRGLHLG